MALAQIERTAALADALVIAGRNVGRVQGQVYVCIDTHCAAVAAGGIVLKRNTVPCKSSPQRGGDLVNKDCTAPAIIAHSTSGVARKGHVIHVKPLGALDVHSAAVSLLGAVGGKFAILKAGSDAVEVNRTSASRVYSLVAGKCCAYNLKSQVLTLVAAGRKQCATKTPVCSVVLKAAAIDVNGRVNRNRTIAVIIGSTVHSAAIVGRRVVLKGVALGLVDSAIVLQGTQRDNAVLIIIIGMESDSTAKTGAVVSRKSIGRKICRCIAVNERSTAAAPVGVARRGRSVSVKGAAIHIYVDIGVGVAGLPPGGDSAAIAGGGVLGKGAALYVQLGPLRSIGF